MSHERDLRHLAYIRDSIALIEARARLGRATFLTDVDQQDAIPWRLFTLADAATQLSEEVQGRHPEIPWRRVAGFRNVAAHAYLSLVLDAAWEIVEVQLPLLKLVVQEELAHPGAP